MSLRKKTLLITGSLIILLVIILYIINNYIFMDDFKKAEEQVAQGNIEIALNIFHDNISGLGITAADWSAWDDTYDFVVEPDDAYVDLNLSDENFAELKMNFMLVINNSGEVIYGKGYDFDNNVEIPIPKTLLEHLKAGDLLLGNTAPDSSVKGVFLSGEGPLLIASRPIIRSNFSGPIRGTFVMGRFLNANAIDNLSSSLNLLIEMQPADAAVKPPDYQSALANISDEIPFYIQPLNDDSIAAYAVINDIYGNPGLIAKVETPREIYKIGRSSIRYYIFSFLLVGLIIGGINLLLLEKTVLSRLSDLISSVKNIGQKNDLSQRLTVDGRDELSSLSAEINETLSSLERYHLMLQETEDKHRINLESQVAERTSELQSANEQLMEERMRLYYLLENLPFIVCLIAPDHSVVFANQYFIERFGSPEGKTCFGLYWNRAKPCEVCPASRVIEKNIITINECTIIDERTYQFFYYPFHDMDGSLLVLELGIDVTEHKQMEKEIAHLDRLNLVGEMAAGIGHEIRNPLTAVRGLLQLLGEKEDNAKYKEYYDIMIEELDRSNSIITEFLSLAKNKPVQLKAHNLNQMVNAMLPLISADAAITDKCVETDLNNISELQLDEKEIRQLILNLVRNGMEEMPRGGKITIKTYEDKGEVVLAIADQGKGIDPEILKNIGTPFLTTKENGTGLGLAVCYSIAARHNAVIEIKTGTGGTTFYIKFKNSSNYN